VNLKGSLLIFIGPPCCGKGTISRLCVEKLGFTQLSTGNLCRHHIEIGSDIGKEIDFALKSGKLISNELITEMVKAWLEVNASNCTSVILDGYPRTVPQARDFYDFLSSSDEMNSVKIIHFQVSEECLMKRACGRLVCKNSECQQVYSIEGKMAPKIEMICDICSGQLIKRLDDTLSTVEDRIKTYYKHESGLLNCFNELGMFTFSLAAENDVDVVFANLKKIIGA